MMTDDSSLDSAQSGASSDTGSSSQSDSSQQPSQNSSAPAENSGTQGTSPSSAAPVLDANGQPAAPAYQPNFKFKAFGKEHEIEETFRSLIKDKETEEKIRKFHEKAYAMETFQENEKKLKTQFDQFRQTAEPNLKAMNHFNNLLKNKDWDNFFGGLKVPDEEIFNWVEKRLQMRAMPAEQRAEVERQAQIRQQAYQYQNELAETQNSYQQLASETRAMQLENSLARPDVQSQAAKIDALLVGNDSGPQSFRELVIEEAVNHFNRSGEDLPANQAVQMALAKYSRFLQAQNQSAPGPQVMPNLGAAPQGTSQGQAPIIPHVGGSARSPVKKQPKSLEDLKNMAKNL